MANKYGKTWWGEQWLNSLNNIDYSNRLPRGRTYANKGSVKHIKTIENQIHAKVSGSRPQPYKVDIILPPFFDPELSVFIQKIAQKPTIASKLLHRELDPQILTIAEECGLKVFPGQWTDFKMQCSCPDWAVPCKHLAAVIYKVSAEIDNNPFMVFDLHRVNLLEELEKLGIQINEQSTKVPGLKELHFDKKQEQDEYDPEKAYFKLDFSQLSPIHEPLIALLADFPPFYQSKSDFKSKYEKHLKRIVKVAQGIIQGKKSLEDCISPAPTALEFVNTHSHEELRIDKEYRAKARVNAEEFSLTSFLVELNKVPSNKTLDYQPSTAALHSSMQLALHLLANGAVIPQIVQLSDKSYVVRWLPALLSKEVRTLMNKLETMLPPEIFLWLAKSSKRVINRDVAANLLSVFITAFIDLLNAKKSKDTVLDLFFSKDYQKFGGPGESAIPGGMMSWLQKYYITQGDFNPQILVSELENEDFKLDFKILPKEKGGLGKPISLKKVLTSKEYDAKRFEILQSLTQLSNFVQGLDEHINSKGKHEIVMDIARFTPFLMDIIPAIKLLDISVLLPKSLQQILRPKPTVKIEKASTNGPSFLRLDKMLDFDWQVAIGNQVMSEKEFKVMLSQSEGLIKTKAGYIYVEEKELEKLFKHFSSSKKLNSFQMLHAALSGEYRGSPVSMTDEVMDMIEELTHVREIEIPKGIKATLRPYQKRGFSWMYRNAKIGFGSVIADDMGLGKTLQVISALMKYKEEGLLQEQKALVVAPTGLLTNWLAEIEKFAPDLSAFIFHGPNRNFAELEDCEVIITSYGILRSDAKKLKKQAWYALIIDEAQNIKNVKTQQAKAVKSIPAENFIAMSGTPVENRLSELWSILDFSNRGYLGSVKEFNNTYGNPIQQYNDHAVANKLKTVTAPFLMRRLKTDKSIISDLPEKIEMDCFAHLEKKQAVLYHKTLEEAMNAIEEIDPKDRALLFQRQGLVLQMIMALKQICNHPTQFLKDKNYDPSLSGKTELLFDKLDSIVDSGEKVLIFTQYTEMGDMLQRFIQERYGMDPLYYHGGVNIAKRKKLVENFQTNPADKIFVLSIKAAGTGLNLTAANHVIHYDLWWNPAVEAQATDRAYRIGQKKNVMVHRFITKNTFEERINEMIQSKKALAELTVSTGENWIGNLSNKELRELFA